jgi:predicted TIM-barrel fold metal-dependent hydrolase
VDAGAGRPLGDYLLHVVMQRAHDADLPVQVHTGYPAGVWGTLAGVHPMGLLPLIEKYRRVRFALFHAAWPWTSAAAAIAKSYPNVWLDMCWAWALDPAAAERALGEWLDAVPYTKIFAFGADTHLPWCNLGYALQARQGIADVLAAKIARGVLDTRPPARLPTASCWTTAARSLV